MHNKRRRFTVEFPQDIFDRLVKYQEENYLPTMTATVIQLVIKALDESK